MRLTVAAVIVLLWCECAAAGQKSITFYLDAARVEQECSPRQGVCEVDLPEAMVPGSLRVKAPGGTVLRVERYGAEEDRRRLRDVSRLEERKADLQVKLQGVAAREEIFTAAAKSQSGKGLRRTKSNPDPAGSLTEGTELALARLDAAFVRRHRLQAALERVERELARARKGSSRARIWFTGRRARVCYLVSGQGWTPRYDFRWDGDGKGELLLHARLPSPVPGVLYLVSEGTWAQQRAARPVKGSFPTLSRHPLTQRGGTTDLLPAAFEFDPPEGDLPPGEAAAYWRGEYLGSAPFAGRGASRLSLAR